MSSRYDKGKGRAEQDNDNDNDDSPFEPEQPRKGPQVGTSNSRSDDAKWRLVRNKSSQQPQDDTNNDNKKESSNASTPTLDDASTTDKQSSREGTTASSTTMQAAPSDSGGSVSGATSYSQQILHRPQKLRIREDVTKSTSFDRERDGDELYNLWVG